jgi:peptidoglycan hydrolase-like protein with peptidoglycan-binding domain
MEREQRPQTTQSGESQQETGQNTRVAPGLNLTAGPQTRQQPPVNTTGTPATGGGGSDLTSPRFSRLMDLEAVFDGTQTLQAGATGRGVQAIQHCLYDLGFGLPGFGADGDWGGETTRALQAFQRANSLSATGTLNQATMQAFDTRFGALNLANADMDADWTVPGVKRILEPWSPQTITTLRTGADTKSFDRIYWTDEEWDGSAWQPKIFEGGGYNNGVEIGFINGSNRDVSQTLYHEVLHFNQPTSQTTSQAKESYAYRIEAEFNIASGTGARSELTSTDAQGRDFADPTKVENFVAAEYPGTTGVGSTEEVVGKGSRPGTVRVRNGATESERAARVGDSIPGPMTIENGVSIPRTDW